MAVREKPLPRSPAAVKHLATGSTRLASAHNVSRIPHLLLDCGGLAAAFKLSTPPQVQPPTQGRTASHESQVTSHFFKYLSYQPNIRFNRSTKCFSSRNPCGSR